MRIPITVSAMAIIINVLVTFILSGSNFFSLGCDTLQYLHTNIAVCLDAYVNMLTTAFQ